jgi:peptide/nickel transport system ATP-binding protein
MRQRAVIAMALACNPEIVIADEPTTALDVIVQDRILKELQSIQDQKEMAMIYISHDVAVIAEVSDTIAVMYAGQFVEKGPSDVVFARPIHPYTDALLASVPSVRGERKELRFLAGEPPSLSDIPASCPFAPRCSRALPVCDAEIPPLIGDDTHWAACHNPVEAILS